MPSRLASVGAIDIAAIARGSFRGFLALVVGTVLFPLVAGTATPVVSGWFAFVCVAGFALAASHQGHARRAVWQGAAAGTGTFALMLPQLYFGSAAREPVDLLLAAGTAPVVGAVTGTVVMLRRRSRTSIEYAGEHRAGKKR